MPFGPFGPIGQGQASSSKWTGDLVLAERN